MDKKYTYKVKNLVPRPRSKRLREMGIGSTTSASTSFATDYFGNSLLNELFVKENIGTEETPVWIIKAKYSLYSVGGITAYYESAEDDDVTYKSLQQLVDTEFTNLSAGQYLKYDGTHWVNAAIDNLNLEGYATEAWVDAKNYVTSQALTSYATKEWVNENFSSGTTDTWRPLGTTADTACAGNDSRLSDARPASDVYSWAKAYSKPSYSYDEVGAAPAVHSHNYLPLSGGSLSGSLTVTGDILATGEVTCYSDRRLKSNIQPLENRGAITPVSYTKDGKKAIGFIAQEVKEVYPELIEEDDTDNHYLSMNYGQYTAVLQAQILEQRNLIQALIDEVNELKAKIR